MGSLGGDHTQFMMLKRNVLGKQGLMLDAPAEELSGALIIEPVKCRLLILCDHCSERDLGFDQDDLQIQSGPKYGVKAFATFRARHRPYSGTSEIGLDRSGRSRRRPRSGCL